MKKIEMFRCMVRSPHSGKRNSKGASSIRYIPSEIFRLWRYLMEQIKGFEVFDLSTGLWIDDEVYEKSKRDYADKKIEKVIEISFNYCQDTSVGRPVIRYFPKEGFDEIMNIFILNFSKNHIRGGTSHITGVFINN
jgi:hypothetical protein